MDITLELFLKLQGLAQLVAEHFDGTDSPLGSLAHDCVEACKNPHEVPK